MSLGYTLRAMDRATLPESGPQTAPDLLLYMRPGCGLCRETRSVLDALLVRRTSAGLPSPRLVERDISTNPAWERAFLTEIPVVELAGRQLRLATSQTKLERLLAEVLGR